MVRQAPSRERLLGTMWLVGAGLTLLTLVLPYRVPIAEDVRLGVAVLTAIGGLLLLHAPSLGDAVLNAVVAGSTAVVAVCTALAAPQVEGVFFFLPLVFAFSMFPGRAAAGHLLWAAVLYAVVLHLADGGTEEVPPLTAWVLVVGISALLAVVLQAGRRDRRIATVLQDVLLPSALPDVPGLALAARYVPAAREADVGGDLFDVLSLPGGRVGLAVGDVAGKGLDAAAAVGRIRSALRAYATEGASPGSVLDRLARVLDEDPAPVPMTTLVYAVLDQRTGVLRWASAGHPPPVHVPADGEAVLLSGPTRPPLGARTTVAGEEREVPFGAGDRLLLVSDGVFERRDVPLTDRLETLRVTAGAAAPGAGGLLAAALEVAGRRPADDVVALAVERLPVPAAPAPAAWVEPAVSTTAEPTHPPG